MSESTVGPTARARREPETPTDPARLLRRSARRREKIPTSGGSTLHLLVLSSTLEDTTVVDLATRTVMRVRVPWPENYDPDITLFDVVEVTLADDPERDDLAQPEATTAADLPRHVGTLRGRQLRKSRGPTARVSRPLGSLLGVPGLPALGRAHRADPEPAAHSPPGRRLHLGPLRMGSRRRLATGRGSPRRPRSRCGPTRTPQRQEPGGRARFQPAVPAGHGQPAPGRPLLQGVRGHPAQGLNDPHDPLDRPRRRSPCRRSPRQPEGRRHKLSARACPRRGPRPWPTRR
jgi:hypothetical protein